MCSLKGARIFGIILATVAILASLGTEGYYAWKAYEVGNDCNPTSQNATLSVPDVCIYDELEVRTYIGLAEGIVGTLVSIGFLIGFIMPSVSIIWVWVVWALGIASYNAYCIKDYLDVIKSQQNVEEFPWDIFIDEDYGTFFIVAMVSVIWYGAVLLVAIPIAAYLTHTIYVDGGFTGGFELQER